MRKVEPLANRIERHFKNYPIVSRAALTPAFSDKRQKEIDIALADLMDRKVIKSALIPEGNNDVKRVFYLASAQEEVFKLFAKTHPEWSSDQLEKMILEVHM